jgi:hypothetical protein
MKTFYKARMISLFLLFFTNGIQAQTTDTKPDQIIQLPQLSLEQKLDRSVRNTTGRDIAGIAYAKSLGKTPEDFGKYIGEHTAFFWADIKGKGSVLFVQYLYRFLQTDRNSKMEIQSVSEKSVKAKMTVYGETNIKALADLNVTIEEYASFYGKYLETLAEYLGLEYKQKFDDGWIVFSVTEKK